MTQEGLYRMARDRVERWAADDVLYWSPRFPEKDPLIVAIENVHRRHQVEMMTEAIVVQEQLRETAAIIRAVRRDRQLDFDLAEPS